MSPSESPSSSPRWGSTTKLVVGLTGVGVVAALVVYLRSIVGPLLLAFILAYALHPLVERINRRTNISWRWSVNIIYLILVIIALALLTLSGFAIVQQLQSLINIINAFTLALPNLVNQLSLREFVFGPFHFSLGQYDLGSLTNQVLNTLQPLLGRFGTIVSSFAASAVVTIGWVLFVLVISYFLLAEAGKVSNELIRIDIPGYNADIERLTFELKRIWNAFLRGQLVVFLLAIILYSILLTAVGERYSLGIALMAGLARFVPYVGPAIVWIVTALVALFQGHNYFGLQQWFFAILVVGLCILLDQIMDNLIVPKFHGQTLGVHPAAVLVAAIVAANLIGFVGLVLAAPVLASMSLLGRYITRKMLDLEPFPPTFTKSRTIEFPWAELSNRIRDRWGKTNRQRPD